MEKVSITCCLAVSENELQLPCNSPLLLWLLLYNLSFSTAGWHHPVQLVLLVPMREGLLHGRCLAELGETSSLGLPLGKAGWAAHKCPHLVECVCWQIIFGFLSSSLLSHYSAFPINFYGFLECYSYQGES